MTCLCPPSFRSVRTLIFSSLSTSFKRFSCNQFVSFSSAIFIYRHDHKPFSLSLSLSRSRSLSLDPSSTFNSSTFFRLILFCNLFRPHVIFCLLKKKLSLSSLSRTSQLVGTNHLINRISIKCLSRSIRTTRLVKHKK
jgi:hypothetical protein